MKKRLLILLLVLLLPAAQAHEGNDAYDPLGMWRVVGFGVIILALFALDALCFSHHISEFRKKVLFIATAACVLAVTAYIVGSTVLLNIASSTQGPVHWHADYEIWDCGQRVELVDPTGLSNRIGSSSFHEHNDDRIHVEGPVMSPENANLQEFFSVVDGELSQDAIRIPAQGGMVERANGQDCDGQPAVLQAFLLRVLNPDDRNGWLYSQQKLDDFAQYVLAPQEQVPPGDCIIIEFGPEKGRTEHLCETYRVAKERGELNGG